MEGENEKRKKHEREVHRLMLDLSIATDALIGAEVQLVKQQRLVLETKAEVSLLRHRIEQSLLAGGLLP